MWQGKMSRMELEGPCRWWVLETGPERGYCFSQVVQQVQQGDEQSQEHLPHADATAGAPHAAHAST